MKTFEESDRYLYDLTPESVVFDCGGYEGNFAKTIAEKYRCLVYVFEPVPAFFNQCEKALAGLPGVHLYMHGVGGSKRKEKMRVSGDSTGAFSQNGDTVEVDLRTIAQIMHLLDLEKVDLLKLNVEGLEFETIEAMIEDGTISRIENLQVQPHTCVPDCEVRWSRIMEALAKTHELIWHAPWCWESWRKR